MTKCRRCGRYLRSAKICGYCRSIEYNNSPKGKKKRKEYFKRPNVKERYKKLHKKYRDERRKDKPKGL